MTCLRSHDKSQAASAPDRRPPSEPKEKLWWLPRLGKPCSETSLRKHLEYYLL